MTLHVGNVGMVATKALMLVEHPQEYVEDRITGIVGTGFGVDVKEDDIGRGRRGFLYVGADHGVAQFVLIKELDGLPGIALPIVGFLVLH